MLGVDLGAYRLFLVALVIAVTTGLGLLVTRTRFGAQLRAAVDNQQAAVGVGVNVGLLFSVTFALGSGLAGLGGALAIDVLGLDPTFGLKYLVYFLVVVVVGGAGSHQGLTGRRRVARRRRRGGQVLRPPDRQLHHLRRHGGAADLLPRRAPWPSRL